MPDLAPELVRIFLIAMALGLLVETTAAVLGVWEYKGQIAPILNVVVMFGMVQGVLISGHVAALAPVENIWPLLFLLAVLSGMAYEALNHFVLKSWSWSRERFLTFNSHIRQTVGIGVLWGFMPLIVVTSNGWIG